MRSEDIILGEFARLRSELVSREEFDASITRMSIERRSAWSSNPGKIADWVMEAVANGDEDLSGLLSFLKKVRRLNRRALREIAQKYFSQECGIVRLSPET